ncbi:MAG: class I adenylate-forming enzyme family protein [Mycobacteriales bacterium]
MSESITPFDGTHVERGADGIARYTNLADSVVAMLRASVDRVPDVDALVELGAGRLTFAELWSRAARAAGGLRERGVGPGDRVAVRLPNGVDWVVAFFGTLMAGAVVVPVNTRFSEAEVDYVVGDSGAAYVVSPGEPLPDGEPLVVDGLGQEDLAAIFHTSGTTGFPKGAMTSHANFLASAENCLRVVAIDRHGEDSWTLISVPLFHVTGCDNQLLLQIMRGGTSVIMPAFDVRAFLAAIRDEQIDLLTTVPAIYWLAINQPEFSSADMASVRFLSYGGAPIAPELVNQIKRAFPNARVGNGYGLTETAAVATYLPDEYAAKHAETVGFACPVNDVKLDDIGGTGSGELLIRGQNVVMGYWNKPEATAAAFVDGWLHTGDIATIDGQGFIAIVDRAKDMINRGGENVYCVEVENAMAMYPAVYETAVIGVPDEMMGEKVGAIVVPKPGQQVEPAELAFLSEHLADFKVPEYVVVRAEPLPRNAGGKILKPPLREGTQWGEPLRKRSARD